MTNLTIIGITLLFSLVLGFIKYGSLVSSYKGKPWQLKFLEIWNNFISFFIGGMIGYYFVSVRWNLLLEGEPLSTSDFVLIIIFALCIFGHLPVLSLNISEGIAAILKRVLEGK